MPTTQQAIERRKLREMPSMKKMDKAYDAAYHCVPKYSMRMNTTFGAQIRPKMCESQDTAGPLDVGKIRYEPPKYSIRKRTCKLLQLPGQTTDSVPGPGNYKVSFRRLAPYQYVEKVVLLTVNLLLFGRVQRND